MSEDPMFAYIKNCVAKIEPKILDLFDGCVDQKWTPNSICATIEKQNRLTDNLPDGPAIISVAFWNLVEKGLLELDADFHVSKRSVVDVVDFI
jgi:hypothetical protein